MIDILLQIMTESMCTKNILIGMIFMYIFSDSTCVIYRIYIPNHETTYVLVFDGFMNKDDDERTIENLL